MIVHQDHAGHSTWNRTSEIACIHGGSRKWALLRKPMQIDSARQEGRLIDLRGGESTGRVKCNGQNSIVSSPLGNPFISSRSY